MAHLAINPNTVLKAYRELEHEGLVAARPGVGTFVTRTLTDNTLAAHGPLRQSLRAVAGQGPAGRARRREHRGAVPGHLSLRGERRTGQRDRRPVEAQGLGKKYGRQWALSDCTLEIPAGRVVGLVGPNGAGKSTLLNLAVGLLTPIAGDDRGARRPADRSRRPAWPRSASSARTRRRTPG